MSASRLFDREGAWDLDALAALTAADWAVWLDARLHRRDPFVACDPDEDPADLFTGLIEKHPQARQWPALAEGAANVLGRMDPLAESEAVLGGAIEIVAYLHARTAAGRVCDWIRRQVFLRERRLPDLHGSLLYALAGMQRRGHPIEAELLRQYLQPLSDRESPWCHAFMAPSFAGIVLGAGEVPEQELIDFLRRVIEAEKTESEPLNVAPAALALFVERDSPETTLALWDILMSQRDGDVLWARLREALRHTRYALPPVPRRSRFANAQPASSLWEVPMMRGMAG